MNINSFIKYSTIVIGSIGLIFTAYRIYDEKEKRKPAPMLPLPPSSTTLQSDLVAQNRKMKDQIVPELDPEKY